MTAKTPVILCIMDGWGSSANSALNAVDRAHTPVIDELIANYPHCQLQASEDAVGLPKGQPGNSEVGHLTIGSGRLIMQDLPRISAACKIGEVDRLPPLIDMAKQCAQTGSALHLTGLTSSGGVHAHTDHIHRIAEIMATANIPVWLHIITDGRDTLPKAAADELPAFIASLPSTCCIASITGRYFAMDRDNRWDRTQAFLDVLCTGKAPHHATDIQTALADAYARGETDEFITATCINGYAGPAENDCLLVANFRVDRVRQFLRALVRPEETGCRLDNKPTRPFSAGMLSMTPVADDLTNTVKPLFMPPELRNGLGEIVSKAGFNQLRVAETEKYPHVTFFFNGGEEAAFAGEDRQLVPSPSVATYDLKPEMSAQGVLDAVLASVTEKQHDLIIVNFANPDMVGHTGDIHAAIKAVETVDSAVGHLAKAVSVAGAAMLVTADHGNCEVMWDPTTNSPHTAHTTNPVPCILVNHMKGAPAQDLQNGSLVDLAPTLLALLGIDQPDEMTGRSLII